MQILRNLKLIDMASPKIQEGKMILLEGGRIKEIREEKELAQFQAQEILDLKGNYLIPGLSDTHIHATLPFIVGTDGYKNVNFLHLPNLIAQMRRNLRKLGKKVAMHQTWISGFRKGLQFSVETLEHIPLDEKLNNRDVSTFVDKKIAIIPALKVFGQYLILDEIQELLDQKGVYYLERVPYKLVSGLLNKYRSGIKEKEYASEYYSDYKLFQRQFHLGLSNVSRLHKAGAIIGFGTDSPCDFSFFGLAYTELEYLVRAGLSNFEALQAASRTNAKILGLQTDLGTIEAGKLADLVLIKGDPLRNVSNVKNVKDEKGNLECCLFTAGK